MRPISLFRIQHHNATNIDVVVFKRNHNNNNHNNDDDNRCFPFQRNKARLYVYG